MTHTLMDLGFLAILPASVALAGYDQCGLGSDGRRGTATPRLSAENGWTLHRIKFHTDLSAIGVPDPKGQRIELAVQPSTLKVTDVE